MQKWKNLLKRKAWWLYILCHIVLFLYVAGIWDISTEKGIIGTLLVIVLAAASYVGLMWRMRFCPGICFSILFPVIIHTTYTITVELSIFSNPLCVEIENAMTLFELFLIHGYVILTSLATVILCIVGIFRGKIDSEL